MNAAYHTLPQQRIEVPIVMGGMVKEKPVTFLNWLGSYALLLIPYVGWLVFLTMLFVWSFTKNTPDSKKNWARVNLIFTAVMIILLIVYLIIIMNSGMLRDIMNGTFDYNDYYNSLLQGLE
jgi:hypothetical protein